MFSGLTFGIRQPTDVLLPKEVPTLSISLVASLSLCAGLMLHGIFFHPQVCYVGVIILLTLLHRRIEEWKDT